MDETLQRIALETADKALSVITENRGLELTGVERAWVSRVIYEALITVHRPTGIERHFAETSQF